MVCARVLVEYVTRVFAPDTRDQAYTTCLGEATESPRGVVLNGELGGICGAFVCADSPGSKRRHVKVGPINDVLDC